MFTLRWWHLCMTDMSGRWAGIQLDCAGRNIRVWAARVGAAHRRAVRAARCSGGELGDRHGPDGDPVRPTGSLLGASSVAQAGTGSSLLPSGPRVTDAEATLVVGLLRATAVRSVLGNRSFGARRRGPEQRLSDDYAVPVVGSGRRSVEPIAELEHITDPMAERVVVGAGKQPVDGKALGRSMHHQRIVTSREAAPTAARRGSVARGLADAVSPVDRDDPAIGQIDARDRCPARPARSSRGSARLSSINVNRPVSCSSSL